MYAFVALWTIDQLGLCSSLGLGTANVPDATLDILPLSWLLISGGTLAGYEQYISSELKQDMSC